MGFLLEIPPEVVAQIIQSCADFRDVLALVSTCRTLHSVWLTNSGSIIWAVGTRSIVAFDDALMAVRATAIVKAASQIKDLPPEPFPLLELGGLFRKPSISELRIVFDLRHMMLCMQQQLLHWEQEPAELFRDYNNRCLEKIILAGWAEWERNFFRSMYRVVLIGAMFTRAYMEPFIVAAKANDESFFDRWEYQSMDMEPTDGSWAQLTDEDVEKMRHYPVYNFDADDESEEATLRDQQYESLFGKFAEWAIEDSKAREILDGHTRDDNSYEIMDVMRLLAAFEHLANKIPNHDGLTHHQRTTVRGKDRIIQGTPRKVEVVLFGVFQVEEISMPAHVQDACRVSMFAQPVFPFTRRLDFYQILRKLGQASQRPNHYNSWPVPPAILEFFVFVLRRYFSLRFSETNFTGRADTPYLSLADPFMFSPNGAGSGVLREC